jgi:hypothetical protein
VSGPARPLPRRGAAYGGSRPQPQTPRRFDTGALRRLRDSGALRRIRDTGAMRVIMDTNAMRTLMDTAAMQMLRERYAGRGKLIAAIGGGLWAVLAIVAVAVFVMRSGSGSHPASPSPTSSARSVGNAAGQPSASASATASPGRGSSVGPGPLTVASVEAFGPQGTGDGDNPGLAPHVISSASAAPWQTATYGTAQFGKLKAGTGLVLDMGQTVTVTKVTLQLAAGQADVSVLVGKVPEHGTFATMANGTGVGGTVTLTAAGPLRGRYIEIWFTALPRDAAGSYQESVSRIQVIGQPR